MKQFTLACLAAIALGDITNNGANVTLPTAVDQDDDDIKSSGQIGEFRQLIGNVDDVVVHVGWRTGGDKWDDGYWVQTFAQWPDPTKPGKFMGVSCNALYDRDQDYATTVVVENFADSPSISNADNANGGWADYGIPVLGDENQMFAKGDETDTAVWSQTYKSEYASRTSWQSCGAAAVIWSQTDGKDADANDRYWDIKGGPPVTITTGFRVWEEQGDSSPEHKGDAEPYVYKFVDFGIEEPAPEVIVPDEEELNQNTDSGAAALAASAVAALAALLMV